MYNILCIIYYVYNTNTHIHIITLERNPHFNIIYTYIHIHACNQLKRNTRNNIIYTYIHTHTHHAQAIFIIITYIHAHICITTQKKYCTPLYADPIAFIILYLINYPWPWPWPWPWLSHTYIHTYIHTRIHTHIRTHTCVAKLKRNTRIPPYPGPIALCPV